MSIEKQAEEVKRVKRAENSMIVNPITIKSNQTVAVDLEKKFKI